MNRKLPRIALLSFAGIVAMVPGLVAVPASGAPESYAATITRTEHDIPHIVAKDWGSLGFGAGYAAAETSICTLVDTVLTARGQRSKYLGADAKYDDQVAMNGTNLQVDALMTDIHERHVVDDLLKSTNPASPGTESRAMVAGYAEGVNQYLQDVGGSSGIKDPACDPLKGALDDAMTADGRATALDIWYGVYAANLLASSGFFVKEIVGATPPSTSEPGLPAGIDDAVFAQVPDIPLDPTHLPNNLPIGSNATAIGKDASSTGSGMILGNPHFPWRGRYRFTQQHLTIPGQYDVAGGSLIGSPVVNIGWNNNVAWSHTVSTAYRFAPYEYKLVGTPTTYLYGTGTKQLDHRTVQVEDQNGEMLTEDMYRTPEGYVIDAPALFMGWTPLSVFAIRDANGEQLRTIDTFLDMGKATDVNDLLAKQDAGGGMPWVNTIAADRNGNALYADHSVVPNISNALAAQCMTPIGQALNTIAGLPALDGTRAAGDCAWGTDSDAERPGIFGPSNLPDTVRLDWVMNSNDSYWLPNPAQKLEGYARIIGCEQCARTMRTRMVDHYVMDRLASDKVTPESLRGTEHENRVWAAEAMMPGDPTNAKLVSICSAAGGSASECKALDDWKRHSNKESVGYVLFESFVVRLPRSALPVAVGPNPIWKVQFDANDPVETPRDLDASNQDVITAMQGALTSLRDKGISPDTPWGEVQVAGDNGADPIPLGGGEGDLSGNANALMTRNPVQNYPTYAKPVTYGSSHIQAISFLSGCAVDTKTILTYGQSEDTTRPSHQDQTQLFSNQQWVSFPWTAAQIAAQKVSTKTVSTGNGSSTTGGWSTCGASTVDDSGGRIIRGTSRGEVIRGTPGPDKIYGGGGRDKIYGGGGRDTIYGGSGNDRIHGGRGNDRIHGDKGNDRLYGDKGNDRLYGDKGDDLLQGGWGNDRLYGGRDNDRLTGGPGRDTVRGGRGTNRLRR